MKHIELAGTPAESAISRLFAQQVSLKDAEEVIAQLNSEYLDPWGLRSQLIDITEPILLSSIHKVLAVESRKERNTLSRSNQEIETWRWHLQEVFHSGITDPMAAALSIPPMPQNKAIEKALCPESREAVWQFAAGTRSPQLQLPYQYEGPRTKPSPALCYNHKTGHIESAFSASSTGCPVARGKGSLIQDLYGVIATVTISEVEWPKGTKVYPAAREHTSFARTFWRTVVRSAS